MISPAPRGGVSSDPRVSNLTLFSQGSGLVVSNSSFINNSSGYGGGALNTYGRVNISNSSFIKNSASTSGGAVRSDGSTIRIANSTFSANRARSGGALAGGGRDVTLAHLTMVDNVSSSPGDGEAIDLYERSTNVSLRNSIITGRGRDPLCTGRLAGNIANFIADGSCSAPMSGNALLGELSGGHHPPLDGSPILDAADGRFCPDTDQLGTPRPHGEGCDLGAIESTTALPAPAALAPPPPCPLALQITAANTDAPAGGCPAGSGHDVITLTEDIVLDAALPPVASEITLEGNGYRISGAGKFRIFDVDGGQLTISDMTLRDGDATQGGAIRLINGARVTAMNVAFSDNRASYGGAIATESSDVWLDVSDSNFVGNEGDSGAGAVLVDGGRVNISGSAFLGNGTARNWGGAMETRSGYVNISNSTFSNNQTGVGGAIYSHGADTTLTHVTLMNNRAYNIVGAGIYHHSGTLNLRNSIVAGSGRGDDCYGRLTENRGNLSQDGTCSTAIIADPLLAERTGAHYPLLNASPAHAAADPAFCLPTDQLGNPRTHCDIGAIESERTASEQPPAAIVIPADCTLAEQIIAANTDAPAGSCPAGQGADIITLR